VDNRTSVRDFLVSRRSRITPEQVGLPSDGRRRVAGLRRGEVAGLAGVSVEYYSKLERGDLAGASGSVLEAVARALRLDDAEREHLFDLARAANGSSQLPAPRRTRTVRGWQPRPSLQWALDAIHDAPAAVGNGRGDLLAVNHLGRALYCDLYADPSVPPNFSRFTFLTEAARRFYTDWDYYADMTVAMLRTEAGRNPGDRALHELVGELSTRSEEFRRRWSSHDVRIHITGTKHYHHPIVGDLTLAYDTFDLAGQPGVAMTVYTAEPGSPTTAALRLLASWAASQPGVAANIA